MKYMITIGLLGLATASFAATPIKAKLNLKIKQDRLYAHVYITQEKAQEGKIKIKWRAPKGSICVNSSYDLPYQNNSWHTHSYRTIHFTHIDCTGTWRISVWQSQQKLAAKKITTTKRDLTG